MVRVVAVRCLLEKLITSSCHVLNVPRMFSQMYFEAQITNIIYLTHIPFGDIVSSNKTR